MAQCPLAYAWADNLQGMDPCAVASSLIDVCDSNLPSLQPIRPGHTYPGPTFEDQTTCMCSSVVYALVSACSYCQGGTFDSWPAWATDCNTFFAGFPPALPSNVAVPDWANFDANLYSVFDTSAASSSAAAAGAQLLPTSITSQIISTNTFTLTESRSTMSQTISSSLSTMITFGSDTSQLSPTTASSQVSNLSDTSKVKPSHNTRAIAGGTVGGLLIFATVIALIYWWYMRRRRTRVPPSAAYMAAHGVGTFKW